MSGGYLPGRVPGHIRVSPKHGVNPSMGVCFYCNREDGTVVLPGRLPDDREAPHRAVWTKEPCPKCKGLMAVGIIMISVDEAKSKGDLENPYRTGGWCVMKEEAVRRLVHPKELADDIIRRRVAFVPDDAWDKIGLPRTKEQAEALGSAWEDAGR